jgi:molybdopterin-guanine dinucleotide biosynthesis protein A
VATVEFPLLQTPSGYLDPFLNINTPDDLAEAQTFTGTLQ